MYKSFTIRFLFQGLGRAYCHSNTVAPRPLKSIKPKSNRNTVQSFVDLLNVRTSAGKGGDGCISFLHLFANEMAGPDGGDGGNGAHVIFRATADVKDLRNIATVIKGADGQKGQNKDCHGKNADHLIVKVPIGTIIRDHKSTIIADLSNENLMFIAAKGGAGGKGNRFFISDTQQSPEICEYGAKGEELEYTLEVKSMAHMGLIGFPNAGKSTLLRAISRARPKVAPYPFTTLRPYLGMVEYEDYEQIAVADLPGLIEDSHKNKGLGIQFLKHAERCMGLIFMVDISEDEPWRHIKTLQNELLQFSGVLGKKPRMVLANKIDLLDKNNRNLEILKEKIDLPVIPISAKIGTNIYTFLSELRKIYDASKVDET